MANKDILVKFGQRVRKIRREMNLSQEGLSYKADLHRTYIGMIERAEKNITLINIEKIAKALNIDLNELFDGISVSKKR
ncbi:MAG: helix-turn-helix transcriptional regulator [Chitinophagales bacterium]